MSKSNDKRLKIQKEYCHCGFSQSHPIPHNHEGMSKPEKIEVNRDHDFACMCCVATGRNEALDEYEKWLPSEKEIEKILTKAVLNGSSTEYITNYMDCWIVTLAKAINERIRG